MINQIDYHVKVKTGMINDSGEEIKLIELEEEPEAPLTGEETEEQKQEREEQRLRILEEKIRRKNEFKTKEQNY